MKQRPLKLLFDAKYHGKFDFEDFLSCDVPANYEPVPWSGRTIYRPSKKLKAYHAFLNSFLFEHLSTNQNVAFAYRKGANPHHALAPHANGRAFFQTDLVKFFDSITTPLIRRSIPDDGTPIVDLADHIERILEMTTIEDRLPIGFSTSPALSNACLKQFDDAFEAHCRDHGLVYSRYADDILVSADDRTKLEGIDHVLAAALTHELGPGFHLNAGKSKLTTIGRKVKALGMVILPSGQISIDMGTKKKVEYQLHFFTKDRTRLLEIFKHDMEAGLQQLAGHISHINAADPAYLEKLRKKYGATVVDSFLHRSAK